MLPPGGQLSYANFQVFSFFSLDGGSQWEDTSGTTAPDCGTDFHARVRVCAARPSLNPWSRIDDHPDCSCRNKFGRARVLKFIPDCGRSTLARNSGNRLNELRFP